MEEAHRLLRWKSRSGSRAWWHRTEQVGRWKDVRSKMRHHAAALGIIGLRHRGGFGARTIQLIQVP